MGSPFHDQCTKIITDCIENDITDILQKSACLNPITVYCYGSLFTYKELGWALDLFVYCVRSWPCGDPESFVRGYQLLQFFLSVDEGREDPSTTISGPSSVRQRNAIKWRFAGMPMMAQH